MNPYGADQCPSLVDASAAVGAVKAGYAPMRMGQAILGQPGVVVPGSDPLGDGSKSRRAEKTAPQVGEELARRDIEPRAAVQSLLSDPRWDFWRLETLIQETGLPQAEAQKYVENPEIARRPWGRPDADLFARADKRVTVREVLSLVRIFVSKRTA